MTHKEPGFAPGFLLMYTPMPGASGKIPRSGEAFIGRVG